MESDKKEENNKDESKPASQQQLQNQTKFDNLSESIEATYQHATQMIDLASEASLLKSSKFNFDLDRCNHNLTEMNKQLIKEDEYNDRVTRVSRKARLSIYKKELINDQLIKMYKIVTNNLIKINLNNLNEIPLSDFKDYFKLVETHTELSKLLVNLTSPIELLYLNRNFIFSALKKPNFNEDEEKQSNVEQMDDCCSKLSKKSEESLKSLKAAAFQTNQSNSSNQNDPTISEQSASHLSRHIDEFKNIFIKNDYFMDLSTSLLKLIEFYFILSEFETDGTEKHSQIKKTHLNAFKSILLNDLLLNLCLLRNFCLEKNEAKLTVIVCRLFDFKMESILIRLANLKKVSKDLLEKKKFENITFVLLSLLFQIYSLLFSKLNTINNKKNTNLNTNKANPQTTNDNFSTCPPASPKKTNAPTSSNADKDKSNNEQNLKTQPVNKHKASVVESNGSSTSSLKSSDYTKKSTVNGDKHSNRSTEGSDSMMTRSLDKQIKQGEENQKENECKYKLNKLGVNFCKSAGFAFLVDNMLQLLQKNLDSNDFFDISYFFWLIKFVINSFVIKNLDIEEQIKKYKNDRSSAAHSYRSFIFNNFTNNSNKAPIIETLFLNDSESKAAFKTRKCLLSYELLAFVCFKMLNNFEKLIFDSNKKNMEALTKFRIKEMLLYQKRQNQNTASSEFEYEFNKKPSTLFVNKPPPPKVANINCLRVLFLSLTCLHEIINCVSHHLSYLNSSKSKFYFHLKPRDSTNIDGQPKFEYTTNYYDFIKYLNEFLNFEQLKQSFPLLMRFYCYNEHLYTNELVKYVLLTNQLFLNTYENVHEFIKEIKIKKELLRQEFESTTSNNNNDPNETKDSSSISSLLIKKPIFSFKRIYDTYANSDTSFIIKYVLSQFINNDPILNRCVIDFLDSLMLKSQKREYIFHMNLALSLANIALLDNFKLLDQRTKDLVGNTLHEIRNLCKFKPELANKIVFNVQNIKYSKSTPNMSNNLTKVNSRKRNIYKVYEDSKNAHIYKYMNIHKRRRMDLNISSEKMNDSENINNSLKYSSTSSGSDSSKLFSTGNTSSSVSSLRSTSPSNQSSPLSSIKLNRISDHDRQTTSKHVNESESPTNKYLQNRNREDIRSISEQSRTTQPISKDLRLIIENEFLYCLFNLNAFGPSKASFNEMPSLTADKSTIFKILSNSDHLYRIFNYLIRLFESYCSIKLTSWQIYNCLLNMKFDLNDKLNYLKEINDYNRTGKFNYGLNLGFIKLKDDFFRTNDCINLRIICSTHEFQEQIKRVYIKYLIEKLCIKSKHIRSAIFWLYYRMSLLNEFKKIKLLNENNNSGTKNEFFNSKEGYASIFELKMINYHFVNRIGVPFIPFSYELQQVFHSMDFTRLLQLLGIIVTDSSFPYLPVECLETNSNKLSESLTFMGRCLGI